MAEHETIDKIKSKQGVLSKIQNFFTLGYGTKEDIRELDKKLRDFYYQDLRDMRHEWEDIYLDALEAEVKVSSRDLKRIIQVLDRVMEKVHHGDYGYAGLMDRKGYIREEELSHVFNYDKGLSEDVEGLKKALKDAQRVVEEKKWAEFTGEVERIKGLILTLEKKWNERNKRFRPL